MAANKFATMLHKNTNKLTLILVYTFLEWVLIFLLLLNSLFSYLIIKFAEFFGLKPPCPWCTRLDHVFDPNKGNKTMKSDLVCEIHAKEISQLGYCLNHRKLVESENLCENCLLSSRQECKGSSKNLCFLQLVRKFGMVQNGGQGVCENVKVESLNCSCCGVSLNYNSFDSNLYSSYVLVKTSSWDVLVNGKIENDDVDYHFEKEDNSCADENVSENGEIDVIAQNDTRCFEVTENGIEKNDFPVSIADEMKEFKEGGDENVSVVQEMEVKNETLLMKDKSVQVFIEEEEEVSPEHLEYFLAYNGHGLVPFELIDPITEDFQRMDSVQIQDDDKFKNDESISDCKENREYFVKNGGGLMEVDDMIDFDVSKEAKVAVLDSMEIEEDENSLVFHAKDFYMEGENSEQFTAFPLVHFSSKNAIDVQELGEATREEDHSYVHTGVLQEAAPMANNENESDVSIGTEIPDLDVADGIQNQVYVHSHASQTDDKLGVLEEQTVELQCLSIQQHEHPINIQNSSQLELGNTEEYKAPDTPTSPSDSFKKLLFLEKRDSVTEDSFDGGSVTSELEGGEGVVTVERLKSALRAERKTLQVLYAELEEERSASAIATNQTMAMINRLQEEKAAMQMEALQYQRMMEEQSEYDQEALQLLNELMVKREKEKRELEKELEVYKKKLFDYESKERMKKLRKCGFSSASCSNAEDSDGLSIDLNQESKEEEGNYGREDYSIHNTPIDAVLKLEESLTDFEEERLSILEQLKGLEEKLMIMDDDDEEQHFEDYGVHEIENGHLNGETNGHANGLSSKVNGHHHEKRKYRGHKGKSLLPLFDAIGDENEDIMISNGNGNGTETNGAHSSYESTFEYENKKFVVEEEVDNLYERLQALEADREFLKHSISSVKKGDKGVYLLQEILEHLRDLRNVELRARNSTDSAIM